MRAGGWAHRRGCSCEAERAAGDERIAQEGCHLVHTHLHMQESLSLRLSEAGLYSPRILHSDINLDIGNGTFCGDYLVALQRSAVAAFCQGHRQIPHNTCDQS